VKVQIYCDGACEPVNPGGHGSAAFCIPALKVEKAVWLGKQWKSKQTGKVYTMSNNIAEYAAVGAAMLWVERNWKEHGLRAVDIRTDSQLTVKQLSGEWACKAEHLIEMRGVLWAMMKRFQHEGAPSVEFTWVPREENTLADVLSKAPYAEHGITPTVRG
jgi:ribonuclease HI